MQQYLLRLHSIHYITSFFNWKDTIIFPLAPFILPVSPSVELSESPSRRRHSRRLRFLARHQELAQTQTLLQDASPAPHWWSGHPSSHPMSSIWQPAPGRYTQTNTLWGQADVEVKGMMVRQRDDRRGGCQTWQVWETANVAILRCYI